MYSFLCIAVFIEPMDSLYVLKWQHTILFTEEKKY